MTPAWMKASAVEFRIRYLLHLVIYVLGLFAPWNHWLHLDPAGPNAHSWGILAALLAKTGAIGISAAFNLLLVLGIVCASVGVWLRTWGSAYLGAGVVQDGAMHTSGTGSVIADGPYRHLRNPLYLGTFLHTLALALLMPASGAAFAIVAIAIVQVRLILGEESFLAGKLGAAYAAYCALVPRLVPAMRAQIAGSGAQPRWGQAFVGEIYMWGVAASFAIAGWWYNGLLLMRCVVISLGVSLVVRALVRRPVQ